VCVCVCVCFLIFRHKHLLREHQDAPHHQDMLRDLLLVLHVIPAEGAPKKTVSSNPNGLTKEVFYSATVSLFSSAMRQRHVGSQIKCANPGGP
jgi:hypothetical protein